MKKMLMLALVALLALFTLSTSAIAGDAGPLGRLTKLNVDEDTLNADIADFFFSHMPFSGYKFFDTMNSMVMALHSGVIDGLSADEFTTAYLISRTDDFVAYTNPEAPSHTLAYAMLLREEDAELCERISGVIRDLQADGTLDALKKQYIDDVIAGNEPESVIPEHFDGAKTLKVAVTGDRPPMDYFSVSDEPIGFNTAIVSEVGRRLGINVEFISVDSSARSISLTSGASDVVFWSENGNFGNRENADIEDQPDGTVITEPYLLGDLSYVVLKTSPFAPSNAD